MKNDCTKLTCIPSISIILPFASILSTAFSPSNTINEVGLGYAASVTYGMLCNGWGTNIVLYVPQDNTNPAEKR